MLLIGMNWNAVIQSIYKIVVSSVVCARARLCRKRREATSIKKCVLRTDERYVMSHIQYASCSSDIPPLLLFAWEHDGKHTIDLRLSSASPVFVDLLCVGIAILRAGDEQK